MKATDITPEMLPNLRARERLRGLGEVDIVKAWMMAEEPFELNETENKIRERWYQARALFLKCLPYGQVVKRLMQDFEISIAQARNDVRNMRYAFGELDEIPKSVHRQRAIEMSMKAYRMALKEKDYDGMAKATKVYVLAAGLDKEDPEKIDIEKLMHERTYVEALDTDVRNLMLNFLRQAGGSVDISKMFEVLHASKVNGEYVDYEEEKEAKP